MINYANYWVVTDLDGTLLDDNYDMTPALSTIQWLKRIRVPVIPCTSKTASEVREFRIKYNMFDPFIVENGGAIYGSDDKGYNEWMIVLGRTYHQLRKILLDLSNDIGYSLKPLNDCSHTEIAKLTGLSNEGILKALEREWSVPFLNPPEEFNEILLNASANYNVKIFKGNRMSHLVCCKSDKGKAVLVLKKFLNQQNVKVIALGDSPNDLPLLDIADMAIVIPGKEGPNKFFSQYIRSGRFILAPEPNAYGWSKSLESVVTWKSI